MLKRENLGVAVNSLFARTQNQLHLHISCVNSEVIEQLKNGASDTQSQWGSSKLRFQGSVFRVRKIEQENLDRVDPFLLLATDLDSKGCDMMDHSLALVGATFPDGRRGFYLLDSVEAESSRGRFTGAESLLDEKCSSF
jgi:CDP-diacylglycerol pyrophosphatase